MNNDAMFTDDEVLKVAQAVEALPREEDDPEEFLRGHLSRCILSAVFSLNAVAEAERNVVRAYTQWAGFTPALRLERQVWLPLTQQECCDDAQPLTDVMFSKQLKLLVYSIFDLTNTSTTRNVPGPEGKVRSLMCYTGVRSVYAVDTVESVEVYENTSNTRKCRHFHPLHHKHRTLRYRS